MLTLFSLVKVLTSLALVTSVYIVASKTERISCASSAPIQKGVVLLVVLGYVVIHINSKRQIRKYDAISDVY